MPTFHSLTEIPTDPTYWGFQTATFPSVEDELGLNTPDSRPTHPTSHRTEVHYYTETIQVGRHQVARTRRVIRTIPGPRA